MKVQQMAEDIIAKADYSGEHVTLRRGDWDALVGLIRRGYRKGGIVGMRQPRRPGTLALIGRECPLYTPREQQVADRVHAGLSDREIASELMITTGTVKIMLQRAKARWQRWQNLKDKAVA